jgi:hypothetical protein
MPSNPVKVISLRKAMDRNDEARIAAVIAEFGGDVDASAALTRMAEEIRQRLGHRARPGAGHGRIVAGPRRGARAGTGLRQGAGGSGSWLCPRARFLVARLRKRFEATPARRVTRGV